MQCEPGTNSKAVEDNRSTLQRPHLKLRFVYRCNRDLMQYEPGTNSKAVEDNCSALQRPISDYVLFIDAIKI